MVDKINKISRTMFHTVDLWRDSSVNPNCISAATAAYLPSNNVSFETSIYALSDRKDLVQST